MQKCKEFTCNIHLDLFESAGWQAICKLGNGGNGTYTIFKADKGTLPIYTDKNSLLENYKIQMNSSLIGLMIAFFLYLSFGFFNLLLIPSDFSRILSFIFVGISFLSFLYVIICLMMSVIFGIRRKKGHNVNFPDKVVWPTLIITSSIIGGFVGFISVIIGFWNVI